MANEIRATYDTGATLYALVFHSNGGVWDQTLVGGIGAFTAYVAATIDQYDIPLTEAVTNSTQYRGTFPTNVPAGVCSVVLYLQAGANPVVANDNRIGETGVMYWDGEYEITNNMIDTVVDSILVDTGTTLQNEHAALPTANENRDAILDDATRFSGADMAELAAANIPADVDTLLTRLSAARAGYLDELAAANLPADIDIILLDANTTLSVGAGEIRATHTTGATLYVLMFNAAGQVWQLTTTSFVAYAAADIDTYDIPLAEIATASREYRADWPVDASMIEAIYSVVLFKQAGANPVVADDARISDTRVMAWNGGTKEVTVPEAIELITDIIMGPDTDDLTAISGQLDNVETSTAVTIPAYILSDVIGADRDPLETLSDQLDVLGTGTGATAETYTVTDSVTGLPLDGAHVWVSTDAGGANVILDGYTNAIGQVKFYHDLPTGTLLYLWRELAGYSFTNPDRESSS